MKYISSILVISFVMSALTGFSQRKIPISVSTCDTCRTIRDTLTLIERKQFSIDHNSIFIAYSLWKSYMVDFDCRTDSSCTRNTGPINSEYYLKKCKMQITAILNEANSVTKIQFINDTAAIIDYVQLKGDRPLIKNNYHYIDTCKFLYEINYGYSAVYYLETFKEIDPLKYFELFSITGKNPSNVMIKNDDNGIIYLIE